MKMMKLMDGESNDCKTKSMYFWIKDGELLKKYNDIMKKEFDSEPIYNKKILETKKKSYSNKATDSHDKKMPKVDSNYICQAVILIDFVVRKYESHYPQVFFKECKYFEKELMIYY